LHGEIDSLGKVREDWQTTEIMINVFVLSCGLLNAVDDYLRGATFQLPSKLTAVPFARGLTWMMEKLGIIRRHRRRAPVRSWRESWQASLDVFLSLFIAGGPPDPAALAAAGNSLAVLLQVPLPPDLQSEHIYFPSAFHKYDLTHFDVLALG